jgi:hypothetical protein
MNLLALLIVYETTEDLPNGSALPPPDGGDFWAIVHRRNGQTLWRHISLSPDRVLAVQRSVRFFSQDGKLKE